jgi:hypothetical protein
VLVYYHKNIVYRGNYLMTEQEMFYARSRVESQFKGGASWFYWIAGLSLINTGVAFLNGSWNFIAGLGITQIIDAYAYMLADYNSKAVIYVGLLLDLLIIGMYFVFGKLALKRKRWVFITGMVLYSLDAIIFLFIQDYFSVLFHVYAVYCIYKGLKAANELTRLEGIAVEADEATVDVYSVENQTQLNNISVDEA